MQFPLPTEIAITKLVMLLLGKHLHAREGKEGNGELFLWMKVEERLSDVQTISDT